MSKMRNITVLIILTFFYASFLAATGNANLTLREYKDGSCIVSSKGTDFGFFMPETGGYFRTGIISGDNSVWLDNAKKCIVIKQNKGWMVDLSDPLLGKGRIRLRVLPLSSSNGIIMEVEGWNLPEGLRFVWSYGGCSGKTGPEEKEIFMLPEQCRNNVFSREINSFTVYYASVSGLKVMMGVAPENTVLSISDSRAMDSPIAFLNSGKKTDFPALSAVNTINSGEKLYYCIYRQNQAADYNYSMLRDVFERELSLKSIKTDEKVIPNTGFGPDFNK